jgi:hypothetical protein
MKLRFLTLALSVVPTALAQNGKHPFTFEEDVDLEANTKISHVWIGSISRAGSKQL